MKRQKQKVLSLPSVSPDLSIFESTASSLNKQFYAKRYTSEEAALKRFMRIFVKDMDQKMIQDIYKKYTNRLQAQMTKY